MQPNYACPQTFHPRDSWHRTEYAIKFCQTQNSAILPCHMGPGQARPGQDIWLAKNEEGWSGSNCQTTPLARPTASQHDQQQQKPPSTETLLNHPQTQHLVIQFSGPPPSGTCIMQLTSNWFHFRNYLTDCLGHRPKISICAFWRCSDALGENCRDLEGIY